MTLSPPELRGEPRPGHQAPASKPLAPPSPATQRLASSTAYGGSFRNIEDYVNRAPDPRLNSIIAKTNSPLRQGMIRQTDEVLRQTFGDQPNDPLTRAILNIPSGGPPQKHPFAVRFHFNPTTLDFSYSTDESAFDRSSLTPAQTEAIDLSSGTVGLGFNLLFDRTYEVAYGDVSDPLKTLGVKHDIIALEHLVGARYPWAANAESVLGAMRLMPCYFIFGGGIQNVGVTFIGTITSMQVTYTSFAHNMVPVRAAVQVTVSQLLGKTLPENASGMLTDIWRRANPRFRNIPE